MSDWFTATPTNTLVLVPTTFLLLAGTMGIGATAEELLSRSPERGGIGLELQLNAEADPLFSPAKPLRSDLHNLDERLSIIVTDRNSASAITFSKVMGQLARDMKVDKLTLFQRWWDTANKIPDDISDRATNIFCNSESKVVTASRLSKINGFPYQCPRAAEGRQAILDPFTDESGEAGYTAIAFSNRFDLADKDRGRHCGEFRIVFARNSGFTRSDDRNLIIFEALVPNPSPLNPPAKPSPDNIFVNLGGCRPIVEFWRGLSDPQMNTIKRGELLRDFFLKGLPEHNVGPVVDARHYAGGPASGQIRTNQFMESRWTLREFKTYGGSIVPATVKSNPGNSLFTSFASESTSEDPRKSELANYLVTKGALDNLRGLTSPKGAAGERSVFTFAFGLTTAGLDHLNSFDSMEELPEHGDVVEAFNNCRRTATCRETDVIETKMTAALADAGSPLNTTNVIHRIRTQTCAGCHHYSNGDKELAVDCPDGWPSTHCFDRDGARRGIWPSTLGPAGQAFTHVAENVVESGTDKEVFNLVQNLALEARNAITPAVLKAIRPQRISHLDYVGPDISAEGKGGRYKISDTLKLVLMPPRFENMLLYLNQFDAPH